MTSSDKPIHSLGDEAFVSLTTFRRSDEPVSTAVWIARDGDDLVVITPAESGKVKRIKNSGRVELRPCNRGGKVPDGQQQWLQRHESSRARLRIAPLRN